MVPLRVGHGTKEQGNPVDVGRQARHGNNGSISSALQGLSQDPANEAVSDGAHVLMVSLGNDLQETLNPSHLEEGHGSRPPQSFVASSQKAGALALRGGTPHREWNPGVMALLGRLVSNA